MVFHCNHTSPPVLNGPPLLCQQEMEKLASRKLRISAKETMKIAEKLYTQGWGCTNKILKVFILSEVAYASDRCCHDDLFYPPLCSASSATLVLRPTFSPRTWPSDPWWRSRHKAPYGGHLHRGCWSSLGAPTHDRARNLTKPIPPYTPPSTAVRYKYVCDKQGSFCFLFIHNNT